MIRRRCKDGRRSWNFKSSLLELTLLYLHFQMFGWDFHVAKHILYMVEYCRGLHPKDAYICIYIGIYLLLAKTECI